MKKRDLEKKLRKLGWERVRHGANHDIWSNGTQSEPLPRHQEIAEPLARKILRKASNNPGN